MQSEDVITSLFSGEDIVSVTSVEKALLDFVRRDIQTDFEHHIFVKKWLLRKTGQQH